MNRIKTMLMDAQIKAMAFATDKKAASLWEYLLVIAVVCIIGAALISVVSREGGGIASLWQQLFGKIQALVEAGTSAT